MDHASNLIFTRYTQIFRIALGPESSDLPNFAKILWIALGAEVRESFLEYVLTGMEEMGEDNVGKGGKNDMEGVLDINTECKIQEFMVWMQGWLMKEV
jgi:hypothetical protein